MKEKHSWTWSIGYRRVDRVADGLAPTVPQGHVKPTHWLAPAPQISCTSTDVMNNGKQINLIYWISKNNHDNNKNHKIVIARDNNRVHV